MNAIAALRRRIAKASDAARAAAKRLTGRSAGEVPTDDELRDLAPAELVRRYQDAVRLPARDADAPGARG